MPAVSASVNGSAAQQVERGLLGQLGEQRGHLVERLAAPLAALRVDREVEPLGRKPRVAEPVGDRGLHGDVGEIGRTGVEQQRQLAVVDRHLGQHRRQRPVPERLADALVPDPPRTVCRTNVVGSPRR